jgi:O-antigen ligase
LESYSLRWRLYETDEGLRSISEHPLLGVGLGSAYRDVTLLNGDALRAYRGFLRFTRFLHNSYLYLGVKMGLPGLLAFCAFALAFLATGWRQYRRLHDEHLRLIVLALLAGFVGLLSWSFTQSHLLQTESTAVVGLIAGLIAIAAALERSGAATAGGGDRTSGGGE